MNTKTIDIVFKLTCMFIIVKLIIKFCKYKYYGIEFYDESLSQAGFLNEEEQKEMEKVQQMVRKYTDEMYETANQTFYTDDGKKVATPDDIEASFAYAYRNMCEDKSYIFKYIGPTLADYTCKHTKETCLRDSDPNDTGIGYLEWRGGDDEWDKCVIAYKGYKDYCIDNDLIYNPSKGKCQNFKEYCECRGAKYRNNDCWLNPAQVGFGKAFGKTVTQGMNVAPYCPGFGAGFNIAGAAARHSQAEREYKRRVKNNYPDYISKYTDDDA